jgi:hypothetical protein
MGSKFLVVTGNGETTRVNVEALLEDHYRGNGKDVVLLLPFQDRPSQGQVWAHQVSSELGIPTTAIAPENAVIMSLGSASLHNASNPISAVVEMVKGEDVQAFLLWDDEDGFGTAAFSAFQEASVPSYDLCMGLVELSHVERDIEPQAVVTAEIPKVEIKAEEPKATADLAELITKKVLEALKEAGVV